MNTALAYANYLLRAKTRHGIHSPFVYNFLEQYLKPRPDCPESPQIEALRKALLQDSRTIEFEDFGAGSKKVKNTQPQVKELAKNSLKTPKYARLICYLAQYIQARNILELGTSLGVSSLYLAKGNPDATVHTIEGSKGVAAIAREQFEKANARNIQLHQGVFDAVLPKLLQEQNTFDFIFIDGNHTKEATLRYFELLKYHLSPKGLLVFDDINWSEGMQEAWTEIKARPEVRLTMNFFFLGVVSLDSGFSKEDFSIRY